MQDIVLKLGGVASWDQLREAIRDAVGITLDNAVSSTLMSLPSTLRKYLLGPISCLCLPLSYHSPH